MLWTKSLIANLAVAGAAVTAVALQTAPAAKPDVTSALRRALVTQVVTLTVDQRGEPNPVEGLVRFDREIEAHWISVVGADVKFKGSTEKNINRQFFAVDPYGKVINGREIEITGKLGIKDGSGNWDDSYEGTITVAVTAVLAD